MGKLIEIERQARSVAGEQKRKGSVEPTRYADSERRSLVLAECFGADVSVPDGDDPERLSNLFESLGRGQTVNFLRIEIAKAHPQDFFDIAKGAPEEIVRSRGVEDINRRFGISLWARPWRVRVRPAQYVHEWERRNPSASSGQPTRISNYSKKSAFFITSDTTTLASNSKRKADLVGDVVVRLGDISDESVGVLDPTID